MSKYRNIPESIEKLSFEKAVELSGIEQEFLRVLIEQGNIKAYIVLSELHRPYKHTAVKNWTREELNGLQRYEMDYRSDKPPFFQWTAFPPQILFHGEWRELPIEESELIENQHFVSLRFPISAVGMFRIETQGRFYIDGKNIGVTLHSTCRTADSALVKNSTEKENLDEKLKELIGQVLTQPIYCTYPTFGNNVFLMRDDINKAIDLLNAESKPQDAVLQTKESKQSTQSSSGTEREARNNEVLLGMLFQAMCTFPRVTQSAILDRVDEMFTLGDGNENSKSRISKKIKGWKDAATPFINKESRHWQVKK